MSASGLAVAFKLSPEGGTSLYLDQIKTFPLLSPDEEQALARRWRTDGDLDAAHRLVSSHLRLAAKIAFGYRGYGLPLAEMVSEANVGLLQAVERFDPERGFRLATYAMWWIRAAIQEYILHSWSLVRLGTTAQQKKLFFNLRRIKGELDALGEGDLQPDDVREIATRLKVAESDVVMMNRRLGGPDRSLNAPMRDDGESEWQDWIADDRTSHELLIADREEHAFHSALLNDALGLLSERERDIVIERRLTENPVTLERLAERHGVSRERVRQIEMRALDKLGNAVRGAALEERARGWLHSAADASNLNLDQLGTDRRPQQPLRTPRAF
jgi:RNA polymerase sigma-32 factor